MSTEISRVNVEKLTILAASILQALGVKEEDAELSARMLVWAELKNLSSHGVMRLKIYAGQMRSGLINLNPKPRMLNESPSIATMDGDRGLGFVACHSAMKEAINRAEKTGSGFVTVRNSTHSGALGIYTMMAVEHDMIGIAMSSVGGPSVLAPDSTKPATATNPLSVAAPAGKKTPFLLDMATSVVAGGKLMIAEREGKPVPEGWARDGSGNSMTDAAKINEARKSGAGGLLPFGGYKGFGIAVLVDILCGILSGSMASILKKSKPGGNVNIANHFLGALRISSFLPLEDFKNSMDEMIEAIESLPTKPGVDKIYVPGGEKVNIEKEYLVTGVPIHSNILQELQQLANELDVGYDL